MFYTGNGLFHLILCLVDAVLDEKIHRKAVKKPVGEGKKIICVKIKKHEAGHIAQFITELAQISFCQLDVFLRILHLGTLDHARDGPAAENIRDTPVSGFI